MFKYACIVHTVPQCTMSEWMSEWMYGVWRIAQSTKPVSFQKYLQCTNSKWNDSNDVHGFKEILSVYRFLGLVVYRALCLYLYTLPQSEYFLVVGFVSFRFTIYLMFSNGSKLHKSTNWTSQLHSSFFFLHFLLLPLYFYFSSTNADDFLHIFGSRNWEIVRLIQIIFFGMIQIQIQV